MNLAQSSRQALLAELAALAACPRAEGYACVAARREHGVRSVNVERPTLAIVLQGRKRVRSASQALEFAPGDVFLMLRRCRLDAINIPDAASGLYLTLTIPLCEQVIEAARLLWTEAAPGDGEDIARLDSADLADPLLRWTAALRAGRYAEARTALAMLVIDLCRRGHTALLLPPPPSLAGQLHELVLAQPAREWKSHHFEQALGLSGATLRRRLAAENTHLREIVATARLACAIELLYTTRWPVKTIAARVGYRSVSSFTRRFVARYGLEPGRIGNAEETP
ncbi:MAG: helix-turn-helix domain-containing protein [Pseudoxanthomonas sp.]